MRRLAQQRINYGLPLKDIVTINSYADFKDDACRHMLSQRTISLLQDQAPEDKATTLVLKACHHLCKVWTEDFTNPKLAVKYAYRCAGVWELQERYVTKVLQVDRPSDRLPSYQFRDGANIMADFTVVHFLVFHRHMIDLGKTWADSGLSQVNSDDLENTHGHGRGLLGNQANFHFKRWREILGTLFETAACQKVLEAAGVIFGAPKHKQNRMKGGVDLGCLEENVDHDTSHRGYLPPSSYDEFVQDMIEARERGLLWARNEYIRVFGPLCLEQFKAAGEWEERKVVPIADKYLVEPVSAPLCKGMEVRIEGLSERADLNGTLATCERLQSRVPERWAVRVQGANGQAGGTVSVKPSNLARPTSSAGLLLGCRKLVPSTGPLAAANLRKREKVELPDGVSIASGHVRTTVLPSHSIHPSDLLVPKKVEKN